MKYFLKQTYKKDTQTYWVSLKLDSAWKMSWRKISRPHRELELGLILKGMLDFTKTFPGELVTETMLVQGINIDADGNFLASCKKLGSKRA